MSKAKTVRFICGLLLFTLVMTVRLGYTDVIHIEEDGMVTRRVTETRISFFCAGCGGAYEFDIVGGGTNGEGSALIYLTDDSGGMCVFKAIGAELLPVRGNRVSDA